MRKYLKGHAVIFDYNERCLILILFAMCPNPVLFVIYPILPLPVSGRLLSSKAATALANPHSVPSLLSALRLKESPPNSSNFQVDATVRQIHNIDDH